MRTPCGNGAVIVCGSQKNVFIGYGCALNGLTKPLTETFMKIFWVTAAMDYNL